MQLSGLQHRTHVPTFVNHTPREITVLESSPSGPEMLGPTGMAISAGPLYVNAIMGQAPSVSQRDYARKASSTILREDSIHIEESDALPTPDSFSIHHDCTSQAPYDDKMMTQASLLHLPKENPSHDLAFFLRTTGPTAPHRRPSKIEGPERAKRTPKHALRFFGVKRKGATKPLGRKDDEHLSGQLRDEGGLLPGVEVPNGAEQKFSSTGKRYLALQLRPGPSEKTDQAIVYADPTLSPSVFDSRVSICIADAINSPLYDAFETWQNASVRDKPRGQSPTSSRTSPVSPITDDEMTIRAVDRFQSPTRPAASSPPSPEPASAVSMAESYQVDLSEHPAKQSFDVARALSSHPVRAITSPDLPMPQEVAENGQDSRKYGSLNKEVEIKHPSPRRFASQPLLLRRASSIASSLYPRNGSSDSPGPPPPRSPLRLRRDPRTIESILAPDTERKPTPKIAPPIKDVNEQSTEIRPIKPTVTTDCTGPIKRPKSCGENHVVHPAYPASRKQREERTRARKLRDRPILAETIDAVVNAPTPEPAPRQRLKKARPQIQTSDLKPAPLATRASSTASSNASWKKITEYTRTPVSAVPSETTPISIGEATGYTPVSPTASNGSRNKEARMALSPVMLVAEQIPVSKTKSPPKPARVVVREGKSYAPRPRSASISRNALKRRSRQGMQTPSRPNTPNGEQPKDEPPPLPSLPPNRALPPTPPASGSEKAEKSKYYPPSEHNKELPVLPPYEIIPSTLPKRTDVVSHIASQVSKKSAASKESARVHARLEALEKQNALLSAALTAVLRTNGNSNHALSSGAEAAKVPSAWESRIARRSAASHGPSSSNGSALDMYMSTRRGH